MKNKPICIIAAREGSKRIKNKNIINFFGKPLISYPIRVAIQSKLFEKVVVSTDSPKIAKIAKKYGAETPFLRKKKLSDDKTGLKEVIKDTIKNINSKNKKHHFYIYATAALLKKNDLIEAFKKIKRLNYDYLISVKKFESNPLRAFKLKNNNLKFYMQSGRKRQITDAGALQIIKKQSGLSKDAPDLEFVILLDSQAIGGIVSGPPIRNLNDLNIDILEINRYGRSLLEVEEMEKIEREY
jgi:CMP-N-acetylneuraminic acid synthetase